MVPGEGVVGLSFHLADPPMASHAGGSHSCRVTPSRLSTKFLKLKFSDFSRNSNMQLTKYDDNQSIKFSCEKSSRR